jgi:signal transduction histidine kinase
MQFKANRFDIIIISILALCVTIGFVYAKIDVTLSAQKRLVLHILRDRALNLELYLTSILSKAGEKLRYVSYNTDVNKNIDFLFNKNIPDEINVAIIDNNNKLIKASRNFDRSVLDRYSNTKFSDLKKVKSNNIVWYYGEIIHNKVIAVAKDKQNNSKVIFTIDFQKILNDLTGAQAEFQNYFKHFNLAIIDNNKNIAITSNPNWLNNFDSTIINRFFQKRYERKARIFQFSGQNYLMQKLKFIPFTIIAQIDPSEISDDTITALFVRGIEIVGGILTFLLLLLLILRDKVLNHKLSRSYLVAKRSNEAKTEFLNFVAHEIKSPLSCIATTAELLNNRTLGPEISSYDYYLDNVKFNSGLIVSFVDDILEEELILKGKFKITDQACNIKHIIDKAIEIASIRYKHRNINIVKDIADNLPLILSDEKRMLQILNNLISNAIKFSQDETTIIVGSHYKENMLTLFIKDEGLGMSAEEVLSLEHDINHINKKDTNIESYGLGFNIVKILVTAFDAKITIFSQVAKGTNIVIEWPQQRIILADKN